MMRYLLLTISLLVFLLTTFAQDTLAKQKFINRIPADTSSASMNLDAVYNRPFLQFGKIPVALGGYAEMKGQYMTTNGKSEGFSFHFQRLTLFVSSSIHRRIKFLTEIEFEDGTKEINIEFASIDI